MTEMPDEFYKNKYFAELDKQFAQIDDRFEKMEKKLDELLAMKYWLVGAAGMITFLFNFVWDAVKERILR